MRLWNWQILPYLPKSQLLSQKRECDLIWKDIANGKQTNHILINYIWEYEDYKMQLASYYYLLEKEFKNRGFNFNDKCPLLIYTTKLINRPFEQHHNQQYLIQCFYNLQEKYDRGQKDFDKETFEKLNKFMGGRKNMKVKELLKVLAKDLKVVVGFNFNEGIIMSNNI